MRKSKQNQKATHRRLTVLGIPRHKDGNRLGLRKREAILQGKIDREELK